MPSDAFHAFFDMASAGPDLSEVPLEQNRKDFDATFASMPLPEGVTVEPIDHDGVRGEWVLPPSPHHGVLLYLHGGGFRAGSRLVGRPIAARLAVLTGARVLNGEYRLAPEHPFPAAVDDVVHTYRWLTERVDPTRVAVSGESAGASLTLALLLHARDDGAVLPRCAYLLSPAPDMSESWSLAPSRVWRDPWISVPMVDSVRRDYLGANQHLVVHPLVSPVFAELQGLPPMLVQVGELEPFRDSILRFVGKARRSGVDVTLDEGPGMFHCWPVAGDAFPEAVEALERAGAYLRDRLTG